MFSRLALILVPSPPLEKILCTRLGKDNLKLVKDDVDDDSYVKLSLLPLLYTFNILFNDVTEENKVYCSCRKL